MKHPSKTLAVLLSLVLCFGGNGFAQTQPKIPSETVLGQTQKIVFYDRDLDSTTEEYCALAAPLTGLEALRITSSASTTVTAVSGSPFADVAAGTYLRITDSDGTRYDRAVLSKSSSTSIVVTGAALTLTSASFQAATISCGTGVDSGAFDVYGYKTVTITYEIAQQNTTGGIKFRLQCRSSSGAPWRQLDPALVPPAVGPTYGDAFTATGGAYWTLEAPMSQCRVGMFIVTADDGGDTATNSDLIRVWMTGKA